MHVARIHVLGKGGRRRQRDLGKELLRAGLVDGVHGPANRGVVERARGYLATQEKICVY